MLEVVFSDSAAGSLQNCPQFVEPGDVLSLPFALSFGDISEPVPGPKRLAALEQLYGAVSRQAQAVAAEVIGYVSKLEQFKAPGTEVRVWYSDTPDELCGFASLMELLMQIHFAGPVWAVKQPCPNLLPDDSAEFFRDWGEVEPERWKFFSRLTQPVSPEEQAAWSCIWRELRRENAPLRAVVNGRLTSVPTDFYDSILRQEIRGLETEFDEAFLIGRTICRLPALGDAIIALRVQEMVDRGELAVIGTDATPDGAVYWRRLRRTDAFPQK